MTYIIVFAIVIVVPLIWWIATGNKFKQLLVKISEAGAGIDVALTKRYDTLSKLLDITNAYAKHEVETFEKIVNLRKSMTLSEKALFSEQLDHMRSRLNVVAENYPELKSSENFKQLQVSAADVEEHLQAARRLYNANVSLLNQLVVSFPISIVANSMKISQQDFFAAEEAKKADVAMKF
ncbi:MAG TPA: LemA family protein [Clostridia bacterium]|nr:LemA family protein [Clostridia bacterium]